MSSSALSQKSLLIIFAYAPAGFGHLRVSDALYHGLPKNVEPILLGAQDTSITFIHRLMSLNVVTRAITQFAEQGIGERIFTYFYRLFLHSYTRLLSEQMKTILDERYDKPSAVLIIATHFGLAHQLGFLKEKLSAERNVKIYLIVQVTDDNPHHIWYVPEADCIFVPSEKTKQGLLEYARSAHLPKVRITVSSYPLSPLLSEELSEHGMEERVKQALYENNSSIHVAVPISGAAVGTSFITKLIDRMHKKSHRFVFHVVSKNVLYTRRFIDEMSGRDYVSLSIASQDRQVVDLYEELYGNEIISLELTKPSEQAFKVLFDCTKRGASLLLFLEPVGQQERDNLDFLRRHFLVPHANDLLRLHYLAEQEKKVDPELLQKASQWRGIELSHDPIEAENFIWWCLKEGIFASMMTCKVKPIETDPHAHELHSTGVTEFWEKVSELIEE